jgi:hypothetical protein
MKFRGMDKQSVHLEIKCHSGRSKTEDVATAVFSIVAVKMSLGRFVG